MLLRVIGLILTFSLHATGGDELLTVIGLTFPFSLHALGPAPVPVNLAHVDNPTSLLGTNL